MISCLTDSNEKQTQNQNHENVQQNALNELKNKTKPD
jgi:hypothetical protein